MENRFNLKVKLRFELQKKLVIGSGGEKSYDVDIRFIRVGNKLFIPGSTIKGALRSNLTAFSSVLGFNLETRSLVPDNISGKEDVILRLFGRPGDSRSKITISPAFLEKETSVITHVTIDERRLVSEEHGLYTAEYLEPNTTFDTIINARDLTVEEAEALFASFAATNFSRIGRDAMAKIKIIKKESSIPKELIDSSEKVRIVMEALSE